MNLLMTAAALGALLLGDFSESSSLIILFAVGITLQAATLDRTRGAIKGLLDLTPAVARKEGAGGETSVNAASLVAGDIVRVLPGERVPVDGRVLSGDSDVDQAQITGESQLRPVTERDEVFAGSMNTSGQLRIEATTTGLDTSLTRIVDLVERAQASKAAVQSQVERFAALYTPAVIALAVGVALVGGILTGEFGNWFYRGLILLVVACPCALIISTPVAFASAIGRASRMGVLFKGGAALDGLARIRTLAFDKTGTVTHGRPEVRTVVSPEMPEQTLLGLAAALERETSHPIARGIARAAEGLETVAVRQSRIVPGQGVTALWNDKSVTVGRPSLLSEIPESLKRTMADAEESGDTVVLVGLDGRAVGAIVLADSVRPVSREVIENLRDLNVEPVLLSGDNPAVVQNLARSIGIDRAEAGLLPAEKAARVHQMSAAGPVGMVGDGINDAPALAQATVGIAMGVGGSMAAIDAADVALMGDDLTRIPVAIELARATQGVVAQNIAFALVSKLAFVALTVGGYTSLWLAVAADMGASLLVTLNAMRLMRARQ
jgi:Cd2+/Zn2+-exporting ATPase